MPHFIQISILLWYISLGVFKRTDTSKPHGGNSAPVSGGKPAGMAALAATYKGSGSGATSSLKSSSRSGNLGSTFGHSKSSTGGSSSSSTSSTIMSADKRLQLMKKKAAQRKKWLRYTNCEYVICGWNASKWYNYTGTCLSVIMKFSLSCV